MAQDNNGYKLSDTAFYTMAGVIFVELVVIGALLYNLRVLLEIRRKRKSGCSREGFAYSLCWLVGKNEPVQAG